MQISEIQKKSVYQVGLCKAQATRLRQIHGEIVSTASEMIDRAIEAGGILQEVKAALPHGDFTTWVEFNAGFGMRTAQRYMKIYENREALKNDTLSFLTDAHKMLTMQKADKAISSSATMTEEEQQLLSVCKAFYGETPAPEIETLARLISKGCLEITKVGLEFKRDVTRSECCDAIKALMIIEKGHLFWIGDLLAYGDQLCENLHVDAVSHGKQVAEWDEKYADLQQRITSFETEWGALEDSQDMKNISDFFRNAKDAAAIAHTLAIEAEINMGQALNELERRRTACKIQHT
jgi:hypothetical protein